METEVIGNYTQRIKYRMKNKLEVNLREEQYRFIQKQADELNVSKSEVVRHAIKAVMKNEGLLLGLKEK